ncbi:hypothetical protein WJX72_001525 [[Myrmecia] bisecta]|uniref:Uncharacterized protein n=1 Tax=[Myrmecia] bisecta TaxID=41462 RepID=A0AAW1R4W8_9CHLO
MAARPASCSSSATQPRISAKLPPLPKPPKIVTNSPQAASGNHSPALPGGVRTAKGSSHSPMLNKSPAAVGKAPSAFAFGPGSQIKPGSPSKGKTSSWEAVQEKAKERKRIEIYALNEILRKRAPDGFESTDADEL